jgi:hypothetical protein
LGLGLLPILQNFTGRKSWLFYSHKLGTGENARKPDFAFLPKAIYHICVLHGNGENLVGLKKERKERNHFGNRRSMGSPFAAFTIPHLHSHFTL